VHRGHDKYKYNFFVNLEDGHFLGIGIDGKIIQKRIVSRMKGCEDDSCGS
jgi:hypothetical protein